MNEKVWKKLCKHLFLWSIVFCMLGWISGVVQTPLGSVLPNPGAIRPPNTFVTAANACMDELHIACTPPIVDLSNKMSTPSSTLQIGQTAEYQMLVPLPDTITPSNRLALRGKIRGNKGDNITLRGNNVLSFFLLPLNGIPALP